MDTVLHRLGLVVVGILMLVCLALLPTLTSAALSRTSSSGGIGNSLGSDVLSTDMSSSSNAVSRSLSGVGSRAEAIAKSTFDTSHAAISSTISAGSAALHFGSAVATGVGAGAEAAVRSVGHTTSETAKGITGGLVFAVCLPGNVMQHVSNATFSGTFLKPADHSQIPLIDASVYAFAPQHTLELAAKKSAAHASPANNPVIWPIRGIITTLFGVPEPPYQPIHTGIDISDGAGPGITPVHPYRAGTVLAVLYGSQGLGNHVIVDHGHGLTSVYGHLDSIAVRKGQGVLPTTVLGREGTTGVSTGVHLHFEIRVNDEPVNPQDYLPSSPSS